MPISTSDFWRLAAASGLFSADDCHAWQRRFAELGAGHANGATVAEWLVSEGALSRYQAQILLSGRPGPFIFGDFVIVQRIETGRLARSFRAVYKGQRPALLVFTTTDEAAEEYRIDQFKRVQSIKSPHVARVYVFHAGSSPPFFVLDDLQGESLRERLSAARPTIEQVFRLGMEATLGLVAMHSAGEVHGNLCPENLWLAATGELKLLPYPLAEAAYGEARYKPPTIDYLAPELADPEQQPTVLSDVYSLGCMLYELIAGRVPFPGGTAQQKLGRHANEFAQRLDAFVPGVDEELADLVSEMMQKDPLLRAQTAGYVSQVLAPLCMPRGQRRFAAPPQLNPSTLKPGYGAWQDAGWRAPPKQVQPVAPPPVETPAAKTLAPPPPPQPKPAVAPAAKAVPPAATAPPAEKPVTKTADGKGTSAKTPPSKSPGRPAPPMRTHPAPSDEIAEMVPIDKAAPVDDPWPADADGDFESTDEIDPTDDGAPYIVIDDATVPVSDPGVSRIVLPRRNQSNSWLIGGIVGGALLVVVVVAAWLANRTTPPAVPVDVSSPTPSPVDEAPAASSGTADSETADSDAAAADSAASDTPVDTAPKSTPGSTVDDDGQTLWVSPTSGEPLSLRYLPSGALVILALRPAELVASAEGQRLLSAVGPLGPWKPDQLSATLGVPASSIELLSIAFVPDDAGQPQAAYVVRLTEPRNEAALLAVWGQPAAAEHRSKTFYQGPHSAFFFPPDDDRLVVVGPPALVKEVLELGGEPLARKTLESLLAASDSTRHVTLLAVPSYLLSDGKGLLVGDLAKLEHGLGRLFDPAWQAVLLSAHLGEEFFIEVRVPAPVGTRPEKIANLLRARLEKSGEETEQYVATLAPDPYGRLIVLRFPRMVQLAIAYTRAGAESRQAVLRTYLPTSAAHNLALGAVLTLAERPGAAKVAKEPASTATAPDPAAAGAASALQRVISLSFPRDTLEHCLDLLSREIEVPIVILGKDLQLEGITKNQSFTLDERDRPAGEVLRRVLTLANPDGKLVYVIRSGENEPPTIAVTTRAAAAKRGERLPAEFDEKSPVKTP